MKNIKKIVCLSIAFCCVAGYIEAKDKKFKNGDFYSGEWQKGKPEGKGKMVFANGSIYDGIWNDGKIAGDGVFEGFEMKFEGTFTPIYENDVLSSFKPIKGTLSTPDVEMRGDWTDNNLFHGTLINKDFTFEGIINLDGNVFNEGTINKSDGSYIKGSMLLTPNFEGEVNKFVLPSSNVLDVPAAYTGKFTDGKFLGTLYGSKLSNSINEFVIEFKDNGIQFGSLAQGNGGVYKGYIKNKKYEGEGTLVQKDGTFTGTWSNGALIDGTIKHSDYKGETYEFSINQSNASYTYPDGVTITLPKCTLDGTQNLYFKLRKYKEEHVDITVKEPNTILSYITPDGLSKVIDLTISGHLYDTDIDVLKQCVNLVNLDLGNAIITRSPQTQKKMQEEAAFANAFFGMLKTAVNERSKKGNIGDKAVFEANLFSKMAEEDVKKVAESNIGSYVPATAFSDLKNLRSVVLPRTATEIGADAFSNCTSLSAVKFPTYLKKIRSGAFSNTALEEATLPATVNVIGDIFKGCKNLRLLDCGDCSFYADKGYAVVWDCFPGTSKKTLILPNNIQRIIDPNFIPRGSTIYCPKTLRDVGVEGDYSIDLDSVTIYAQSEIPFSGELTNCTIYVPNGALTAWYAKYGNGNKIIEGTKTRP